MTSLYTPKPLQIAPAQDILPVTARLFDTDILPIGAWVLSDSLLYIEPSFVTNYSYADDGTISGYLLTFRSAVNKGIYRGYYRHELFPLDETQQAALFQNVYWRRLFAYYASGLPYLQEKPDSRVHCTLCNTTSYRPHFLEEFDRQYYVEPEHQQHCPVLALRSYLARYGYPLKFYVLHGYQQPDYVQRYEIGMYTEEEIQHIQREGDCGYPIPTQYPLYACSEEDIHTVLPLLSVFQDRLRRGRNLFLIDTIEEVITFA